MILKSRQPVTRAVQLCCRNLSYQSKKSQPAYQRDIIKSTQLQSFAVNISSFRNYSINESEKLQNPVNEGTIGTRPTFPARGGREATNLQVSYISDLIADKEEVTDEEWRTLVENVSKIEFGLVNDVSIDGRIMDGCCSFNKLSVARSYLKYMRKTGKKFNSATVTAFIKLCYENRLICTPEDLARMEQFTKFLIARYTVIDSIIGDAIIKGLCLQNDWQKSAEILNEMKQYLQPNYETISAHIICLIENDLLEKAWDEMTYSMGTNLSLSDEAYVAWLSKVKSNVEKVEELLKTFQKHDILPKKIVVDHLLSIYSEYPPETRLTGTYTTIKNRGICGSCNEKLQRASISEEEFSMLRDEFLNRVLINTDVFKNTTPEELEKFFKCVEKHGPFDIVIDGLNVMYMTGTMKGQRVYSKLLTDVVRHFVERDQKVLVIGRKHMYSFSKDFLAYVRENSTLFFIDDSSEDDPYMIYATFYSGPNACFVTRDLMRSEKFRLSSHELAVLFKRWQHSHQIFINHISFGSGRLYLKSPIMFEMSPQPSKRGWHVPYHLDTYQGEDLYGVHEHWLCLKR